MKINLLADYRGVLTDEQYYQAGDYDFPEGMAQALIDDGRAVALEETPPKPSPKKAASKGKK